jgi:formylglycine-generating enzyme required for sulfatase activity
MVSVGDACVDETEVTRSDYQAWLSTSPSTATQGAECSWNTSFEPEATCMGGADVCSSNCDLHPQVCVDWCDAAAFCESVGKSLCAEYSPRAPGETDHGEACSAGTTQAYPYGDSPDPTACNGSDSGNGTTVPAGSLSECAREHLDGTIYDLVGNVWEWQGTCSATAGADDMCELRGGSFTEASIDNTCQAKSTGHRNSVAANIGFRCCAP